MSATSINTATEGVYRLHSNDVVATIQILRRAGVLNPSQVPDALLAVLRAKLLPWTLGDAAMAILGVNKGQMSEARARSDRPEAMFEYGSETHHAAQPRPKGATIPTVRTPGYSPRPTKQPAYRQPTRTRPVSEDGDLCCSVCGKWLPADNFRIRTDRIGSGTRRSACDPCHDHRNRSRYLNVQAHEELNRVGLSFTIMDGDDAASLSCASCGERLEVGQDVQTAHDSELSHVKCGAGARA